MKVFIVQGRHPFIGGVPLKAHRTMRGADATAADLVNTLRADWDFRADATAGDWREKLAELKDGNDEEVGFSGADVWITDIEVED